MRALFVWALVWAGGCGRETPLEEYERFLATRADRECNRLVACGQLDSAMQFECRRVLTTREEPPQGPLGTRRSFADGRLKIDWIAAQECFEATSRWVCVRGPRENFPHIPACGRVVRPEVGLGERCVSDGECLSFRCGGPRPCDGRCVESEYPVPVAEADFPIDSLCHGTYECAEGLVCLASAEDPTGRIGTCHLPAVEGERCLGVLQSCAWCGPEGTPCADESLRCDTELGLCVPLKREGEPCRYNPDFQCEPWLACLPDVAPSGGEMLFAGHCRQLLGLGSPCEGGVCSDFLACLSGTCVPIAPFIPAYAPLVDQECSWMTDGGAPTDFGP